MFALILSPAKNLDESHLDISSLGECHKKTTPFFTSKAEKILLPLLQKMSAIELSNLMGISEKLAQLNYDRFQKWNVSIEKQAVYLFNGDVYDGLKAYNWNEQQRQNAQKYLYILSGFYGVIRPFDTIKPYRLEMGTNMKHVLPYVNLAHYWQADLATYFADKTIINLASSEYNQAIHPKLSQQKNVINIIFENQKKNGSFGVVGIHAKKARGLFTSYLLDAKLEIELKTECLDNSLWHGFENVANYRLHDCQKNDNAWNVIYRATY